MKRYITLVFALLCAYTTHAQTGTIKGTIKDAKTGESIIGASAVIEGTTNGAVTDVNGYFTIPKVQAGTYNIIISYISYKTIKLENIQVAADKVTLINTALETNQTELTEIVITAQRSTQTEVAVISEIKSAQMVVSGISAQQISRSLDRDAAQVVRRVPGVTIIGDRFINIRGLSERYNPVLLHNVFAPSMETDSKSFAFDIIPSSQLDRMLVFKSPSAELPGEFAGGVVKIFTKSIPEQTSLVLDYSTAYRVGNTFNDFYQSDRNSSYWTSFNTGYYDLPNSFPNNVGSGDQALQAGRSLPNIWSAQKVTAIPDQRLSLTYTYRGKIGNVTIGNVTALSYSNARSTFNVSRQDFNTANAQTGQASIIYDRFDDQYNQSIRAGALHNWAFRFNPNHTIEFKNLFNQNSNGRYTNRDEFNRENGTVQNNHSFDQQYRGLYSGQLVGKHKFSENTTVDWVTGYGYSYRDQPDYRRYRSDLDQTNGTVNIFVPSAISPDFLGRFYSTMRENSYTGTVIITQIIPFKNKPDFSPTVSGGVFFEYKDRSFNARNFGYLGNSNFDISKTTLPIEELLRSENINNNGGLNFREQSLPSSSYDATNQLLAYYANINIPLSKKFNLITGVRFEDNLQQLQSADVGGAPVTVKNPILRALPSANVTYNFTDKMLIRGAYGITLNRPEFRELAPFSFYDFDLNVVIKGEPFLKTPLIHNADLRWEYYPTPAEQISFAVFYKNFLNPIEQIFQPGSGSGGAKTFQFANAASAYSVGAEIEIRKSLAGLTKSAFLDDLGVLLNAAVIKSEINLGSVSSGQLDNRPLQGQSPYVINTGLSYNNVKSNWQVNILYNVIGKRIFAVGYTNRDGVEAYPNAWEMPRNVIDISFSKRIGERLTVKGGISDLLNQENLILMDGNLDRIFDRRADQNFQRFKPGQLFSLGFTYTIFSK